MAEQKLHNSYIKRERNDDRARDLNDTTQSPNDLCDSALEYDRLHAPHGFPVGHALHEQQGW